MSETSRILLDTAQRLFAEHITADALQRADGGDWLDAAWKAIDEMGLPLALVPEGAGGYGIDMADALALVRVAGYAAAPLPLAESMVAAWLLAIAGVERADGPSTIAPVFPDDRLELTREGHGWRLRGMARRVPWARVADSIAVLAETGGDCRIARVDAGAWTLVEGRNLAGEPRDTITFDTVLDPETVMTAPAGVDSEALRAMGATVRSLALAGAIERVLDLTVQYAGERVQFGRAIGKFQAIQQNVAVLAGQAAAARAAADAAAEALAEAGTRLPIAAAKVRCGEAAGIAAAVAHQVHGAIGFTHEHTLHYVTRRLWAWREEFGNEASWSRAIGRQVAAAGADALWPLIAAA